MEVAACKPIANVIDTAVDIFLCSYIADSVVRNILLLRIEASRGNSFNIHLHLIVLARLF